jgi:lipopolysaccharide heptosyltransferase I
MPESRPRFLVIRLSSIGDIVHALPAVAALGETYPQAEIHWAVESRYAILLDGNPFVHRLVKLDTLGWRRRLGSFTTWKAIGRALTDLRQVEYDAAVDFQGLYKSALIAWLSRAPARLGFAKPWLREPAARVLYTERIRPPAGEHVIRMNLALVERLGARAARWQFPLPQSEADARYVEQQLAALGAQEFMVLNPGGGWTSKRWAPQNYAELIRRLESEFPDAILLTGSPEEAPLIRDIIQNSGSARVKHFPSTITQFIALVRRAKLFLSGDTGPLHLAAAVGTPIVAIYGPTDPARNGPFSPTDITLWSHEPINYTRRASEAKYLSGVSVESVLRAIHERRARAHG